MEKLEKGKNSVNRLAYLIVGIVCSFASVHACGGNAQTDSTSGNTNWLKLCDTQADCGEDLSCLCNTCQAVCTQNSDCDVAGSGARCAAPSVETQCSEVTSQIHWCVKSCEMGSDCNRDDLTCRGETCVALASLDFDSGAADAANAGPIGNPPDGSPPVQQWWIAGVPAATVLDDGRFNGQDDRYGAFAAPPCPPRAEQMTFTLGEETYALDLTQVDPYRPWVLTKDCDGFATWDIRACDATREDCVHVSHQITAEGDLLLTANAEVGDEDAWVTVLDSGDLGESYWCQENGFWRAWVDFSFTKEAIQYDGQAQPGLAAPLTVTMQAYVDGQVCFRLDTPFPLRHCSEDASVEVDWTCAAPALTCDGDLTGQSCGAFCNDYDTARVELASSCATTAGNSIVQRQTRGYDVLQINGAAGALSRAFYDEESGALIGIWSRSDTGEEQCSGSVPADFLQGFPVEDEFDGCVEAAAAAEQDAGDAG